MSLPRYPEYKDSGVDWLGELPADWKVRKARRLFQQRRASALATDEQLSATQKFGVIPQRLFMEREDQKLVLALGGTGNFNHVEQDDFVISLRSFQGGIERSWFEGCVSPAYTVLRPAKELAPRYWEYLLKATSFISALQTVTDGIREGKNISYAQFGSLELPKPEFEEQTGIAAFLDRETAKIDALLAEQEKLIALLAEERQATISHAVTRGLDPSVPMKDSGVEWLGEVPAHWKVCAIRRVLTGIEQGWSPECLSRPAEGSEWGVLKTGCVNGGVFNPAENKALPETLPGNPQIEVRKGDLLMSRASGSPSLVGSAALAEDPPPRLMLSDKIFRLHPRSTTLPRFLALALGTRYIRYQVGRAISGAEGLANNLPQSSLKSFMIVIPTIDEQREIVGRVSELVSRLDNLTSLAQRAIDLLKERRSALIAAAVTGQIDVREWDSETSNFRGAVE